MLKSMALILISVSLGVGGQLAIKMGITRTGDLQTLMAQSIWRFAAAVLGSPTIMLGIFLYGVSMVVWLLVLSRVDLSLAYPMLALGYVGVLLVSLMFLGEKVTALRWLGTALIVCGVVLNVTSARVS